MSEPRDPLWLRAFIFAGTAALYPVAAIAGAGWILVTVTRNHRRVQRAARGCE